MSFPPGAGFTAAWLRRETRATSLLPSPEPAERRVSTVRRAAERTVSPALLEVLAAQQAGWLQNAAPSAEVARSLELLARGGAAVVVTGQQAGLFGGPLFSIYKAVSAAAAARALSAESGVPVVPLFWLQTEDHDFPEIDHCRVPRPGEPAPLRLAIGDGGLHPRLSVAERVLGEDVVSRLDELEAALSSLPHAGEVMALLREAWQPGRSLAGAFARTMATLLAPSGMLVFDPRPAGDPRVSSLLSPLYARAIDEAEPVAELLAARGRALTEAGFDLQVHVRPGSPLLFLHAPDAAGPRYRLDPRDPDRPRAGSLLLVGDDQARTVERAALREIAERDPRRLSTSALLRPLAQDTLLPTAAYVGGPGEVAYFAQLQPLHARFGLPEPLILHRGRLRCTTPRSRALLDELGLSVADTARPREAVLSLLAERWLTRAGEATGSNLPSEEALRERLGALVPAELAELSARAAHLDPRLPRAAARTRATVERALDRYATRYARALRRRDQVQLARLDRALAVLQPGGEPQERVFGFPWFAAHVGPSRFVEAVQAALADPFDASLRDLHL